MHVLYIEDNLANARLLERFFGLYPQWRLQLAMDAESGLALALAAPPALILMDLNLPDLSGIDALHTLRQQASTATIPVLAVSADARPEHITHVLASGFAAYITKPIDLAHLAATLSRYAPGAALTASGPIPR